MFADRIADPKQIHNRVGLFSPLVEQVRRARKFVLSRPFTFAADALSTGSDDLVKLLPWCRLPYPLCWFEADHNDRKSFVNVPLTEDQNAISKVGFLVEQRADGISLDVQLVWTNAKDAGILFGMNTADVVSDSGLIVNIDPREKLGGMMPASPAPWVGRFPAVAAFVIAACTDERVLKSRQRLRVARR
jgi:hypothetical protein